MDRVNLDLDGLRSFVAGVELGNFSQGAARVGRSPSAVSARLRKLEAQVGQPLLRKVGRGLMLTEAGEAFFGYARRLLELNDEAVFAVRGVEIAGEVRLGLPQDFAERWLPEVLGRFARRHPYVRVEVRADRSSDLLRRVEADKLDVAVVWGEPEGPHAERLTELAVEWIGPAHGEPAWRTGEPLPLVAFEPPCGFRASGLAALDQAGVPWRLAFSSPSLAGVWAAVAAGLGVSMRTSAGLPDGVRVLERSELGLPALPRIGLSLTASQAEPTPAVALLTSIVRETLTAGASLYGAERAGPARRVARTAR